MAEARIDALIARLEKGRSKTQEALAGLSPEQWQTVLYLEPPWTVRDLLAHFVSSEERLLELAQDVAAGGAGAPEGFDFDAFNAEETARLAGQPAEVLLAALDAARGRTVDWTRTLSESQLDLPGRHPALGQITLETMITAIYGHQLLHMRDLARSLERDNG